jgi:hypothetical protein
MTNLLNRMVFDYDTFKKQCDNVSRRATLSYIGLDLIIDKKGDINCIELNGKFSGTKGMEEVYGKDLARAKAFKVLHKFDLPVTVYVGTKEKEEADSLAEKDLVTKIVNFYDLKLQLSKEALGDCVFSDKEYYHRRALLNEEESKELDKKFSYLLAEKMGLIPPEGKISPIIKNFNQAEGIIWNNTGENLVVDEGRFITLNSRLINWITEYKDLSRMMMFTDFVDTFSGENFSSENFEKNEKTLTKYFRDFRKKGSDKVIFKPVNDKCGNGVCIFGIDEIFDRGYKLKKKFLKNIDSPNENFPKEVAKNVDLLKETKNGVVLQPFIESKPFRYSKTGEDHYACVRYAVIMESDNNLIRIHHLGGYARLAPEPISNNRKSQVVNLSEGAHAEKLSEKDLKRIKIWVNRAMPNFYRRALRIYEGDINIDVVNYILVEAKEIYKRPWMWV